VSTARVRGMLKVGVTLAVGEGVLAAGPVDWVRLVGERVPLPVGPGVTLTVGEFRGVAMAAGWAASLAR